MIESERWHWCESESDSTLQVVELVQEVPWWACCSCGALISRLDETAVTNDGIPDDRNL